MIQVFNLYKTYQGNSPALSNISFTVHDGEFIFLTGQSGAGKTTLMRIINQITAPDSGEVIYVENRRPISRATDQTEDIKVIVEF